MRKTLWAMFIVCTLALMSVLSMPAVQAMPVLNASGTWEWKNVEFESVTPLGVNMQYVGSAEIVSDGTFDGTATDAFVELWHSPLRGGDPDQDVFFFLNLLDELTFTGTVNGIAGTLTIYLIGAATLPDMEWSCQWVIHGGTGGLAGLKGQGTAWGTGMVITYSGMIAFR
jgi:hypothetical protein